ncbi:MAG: NAD-dependent epimerase/dehydratase family protein [Thermodesulfobacteriota bacterium]
MRIFIKGATGILGKRLVRELIGRGHSVTGMVRSARGEELVRSMGGTPSRTGLFDGEALLHAVEGSDVVIHAATSISVKTRVKPEDFAMNDRVRREGTGILTECVVKASVKKLIFQDVAWVARPPDGSFFDEVSPVYPDRILRSGIDGESIVLQAGERYGFLSTVLRCGFFYGSDAYHARMIGEGLKKRRFPIIGNGEVLWSSIHVDDAALAFVTAALEDLKGVWHEVDDSTVKAGEFLRGFASRLGAPAPRHIPPWPGRILVGSYDVNFSLHRPLLQTISFAALPAGSPSSRLTKKDSIRSLEIGRRKVFFCSL